MKKHPFTKPIHGSRNRYTFITTHVNAFFINKPIFLVLLLQLNILRFPFCSVPKQKTDHINKYTTFNKELA